MAGKHCTIAFALPGTQWSWPIELPFTATIADALAAAREQAMMRGVSMAPDIDWESATVGIFGVVSPREHVFADGDRIEIYRPLTADPRDSRRDRVAKVRRAGRRT